jgi:hypothetical protein
MLMSKFIHTVLIIAIIASSMSCSHLLMNQGLKSYKSNITKSKEYKKSNHFQQDFLYLNDLCENAFPQIDSVIPTKKRKLIVDSILNILKNKKIDKQQFKADIRFYLSHFDNQHTNIAGYNGWGLFPYLLQPVSGKWFLWDINKEYDSLLIGKQIIAINNEPIEKVEKKVVQYVSAENEITKRNQLWFLNRPSILKKYEIINQTDSILLTFENGKNIWIKNIKKEQDINFTLGDKRLVENPITKKSKNSYTMNLYPKDNFAYFQFNRCFDQIDAYAQLSDYLKPWVVPFAKMFLNRVIKKKITIKNDVGFSLDYDRPIFKDYLKLMFDSLQKQGITNLIIDLRNNGGGSFDLCSQLVYYLTSKEDCNGFTSSYYLSEFNKQKDRKKYDKFISEFTSKNHSSPELGKLYPYGIFNCDSLFFEKIKDNKSSFYIQKNRAVFKGKVIVLANANTGSAAAILTTILQDNNIATVIGTTIGNNPIGATVYNRYRLPHSKETGSVASEYIVRPNPSKGKLFVPDYWIENSVDDLIHGKDKSLEKALELIKNK